MADLITTEYVKDRFPEWESFVRLNSGEDTATVEARLDRAIEDGETKLLEYVDVDSDTITPQLTLYLMALIKKNAFDVRHGNKAFDAKPQILKDYEDALEMLERYRTGEFEAPSDSETERVTVTAKKRRFDEWFHPRYPDC